MQGEEEMVATKRLESALGCSTSIYCETGQVSCSPSEVGERGERSGKKKDMAFFYFPTPGSLRQLIMLCPEKPDCI